MDGWMDARGKPEESKREPQHMLGSKNEINSSSVLHRCVGCPISTEHHASLASEWTAIEQIRRENPIYNIQILAR